MRAPPLLKGAPDLPARDLDCRLFLGRLGSVPWLPDLPGAAQMGGRPRCESQDTWAPLGRSFETGSLISPFCPFSGGKL